MANYAASPHYNVEARDQNVNVKFDGAGKYATDDKAEIAVLDSLAPVYVTKLDAEKAPAKAKSADK